jgi:hypothetical protein
MRCERYEAILKEASLGRPVTPELEAHLRACAACAQRMAGDGRLVAQIAVSLETAMNAQPSADFLARVRIRVAEERERAATRWTTSLSGAAASVAIALALIGAISLGRVLLTADSGPALTVPAASVADAEAPSPAASVPPGPAASKRQRPAARVVDERLRPKPMPGTGVLVDAGQQEALAHLAERGLGEPALSTLAVEALPPAAPLPELRAADLPRFEPKRLEIELRSGNDPKWGDRTWKTGGAASDSDEGSDS